MRWREIYEATIILLNKLIFKGNFMNLLKEFLLPIWSLVSTDKFLSEKWDKENISKFG